MEMRLFAEEGMRDEPAEIMDRIKDQYGECTMTCTVLTARLKGMSKPRSCGKEGHRELNRRVSKK